MSDRKITILIVDDDPHLLEFLSVHIESAGYQAIQANNGLHGLEQLKNNPDIAAVISDVDMPMMDGYAFCQEVRADDASKEIPFIFASGMITLEEKLRGYDCGGDDYITKPLQGEEVVTKVRHILDKQIRHESLANDLASSRNAAMQAMTYTSNLGQVLQFTRDSALVKDFQGLADAVFDLADGFGLSTVVQFYTPEGNKVFKRGGEVAPLEANVLELARGKDRIFDFQARTIYNYPDFSLLIKNMPLEDPEKYGMLKDVLSNLCDATEVKCKLLLTTSQVIQKEHVIHEVTAALDRVTQSYHDLQNINTSALEDLVNRMEDAMFGFGLSESQEDTVRGIISYAKRKTADAFEDGQELFTEFEKIRALLNKA